MTSWPSNFQSCTVTGQYLGLDGLPIVGKLTFTARPVVLLNYDAEVVILPRSLTITLDATGSFFIVVPSTNDPDISPIDWTYTVSEVFVGGRTFDIEAPMGTIVDITKASPVPASTGNPVVRGPRGFAGGAQTVQGQPLDQNSNIELGAVVPVHDSGGWTVVDPVDFREALGLGSVATYDDSRYSLANEYGNALKRNQNLQDLTNVGQALTNLGLNPNQIRATLGLTDAPSNSQVADMIALAVGNSRTTQAAIDSQARAALPQGILGELSTAPDGSRKLTTAGLYYPSLEARITLTFATRRRVRVEAMSTIFSPSGSYGLYVTRPGFSVDTGDHVPSSDPTIFGAYDSGTIESVANTRLTLRSSSSTIINPGTYMFYPLTLRSPGTGAITDSLSYSAQIVVTDMGAA